MIIEIEYYKGDVKLTGKTRSVSALRRELTEAEMLSDTQTDNFTALLCRIFGWDIVKTDAPPDCVYDRDTGILRKGIKHI